MANQDQTNSQDRASQGADGAADRMTGVIDTAKTLSTQDLPDRQEDAREEGERTIRAVDAMGLGNTPHGGDDPQHLNITPMGQMPMPSDTGGKGHVGDTPVKEQK